MRHGAYHLFELVAWPAAVWSGVEVLLRVASGAFDGLTQAGFLGAMAGCTIAACRWRSHQLSAITTAGTSRR